MYVVTKTNIQTPKIKIISKTKYSHIFVLLSINIFKKTT